MRKAFSTALVNAAKSDNRVVLLTGDHGYALFDEFRQVCPDQYINVGVAEQNMVSVAAGMAKAGFKPVVYGLSAFVPVRVLEQIKLDICYENLPVVLVGDGAGVVYSSLGSSHQSTEDIATLRAIPNISILSPSDAEEMTQCMGLALSATSSVYLRMGKADLGAVHHHPFKLDWGELYLLEAKGTEIGFIATGSMVKTALEVAKEFKNSAVWSAPSIKPLDIKKVINICKQYQSLVILEEHSIYGGLGSAIAEIAATYAPIWICRIGIPDRFSEFCGSYNYLIEEHRLDKNSIVEQVKTFLNGACLEHQ